MDAMSEAIKDATDRARKLYGADIRILVARSPAFGHDDTCILVQGRRHAEVAAGFARVMRGARIKTETTTTALGSQPRTYSSVVAKAQGGAA